MADNTSEMSDAEKMRLKRLARLGGPSTPAPASVADSSSSSSSAPQAPSPRPPASTNSRLLSTPTPASTSSSSPTPTPNKPISSAAPVKRPISATQPAGTSLNLKRPSSASKKGDPVGPRVVSQAPTPSQPTLSYEDWEIEKVATVFSVALDRGKAQASDWRLCWLKELEGELKAEMPDHPPPFKTTSDISDRLLIARLSLDPTIMASSDDPDVLTILAGLPQDETVFEYLTGCWKRLNVANRENHRLGYSAAEKLQWTSTFEKLRGLVISYCGMTLEDPTMFPQPAEKPTGPAEFLPLLLSLTSTISASANADPLTASTTTTTQSPPTPTALPPSDVLPFLHDLAAGYPNDTMADVITPTLSLFFQEWYKITPTPDLLGNDWRRYLGAVSTLVQVKPIAALFPTLSVWVAPNVTAPKIEWQSLLGPLTRLSVYPREFPEIWKTYFSDPTERKTADIDANKANLRNALGGLHSSLFNIYNSIVRSSPDAREGVLDFFALVIKVNEKRAGMRVDSRTVSSDGFMTNLQVVLLKLFEPVMDVQFSRIDKIDPEFYRFTKRIDIEDETKIRATKEEADEYFGYGKDGMEVDSKPPTNFISDLFFLLNSFQHLGVTKTVGTRLKAEKNISEMEKELKRTEAARGDWNPALEAQGEAAIKKLKGDISILHSSIHAYDTQLLDPALVRLNLTFLGFLMTWLIRLVDPKHQHPTTLISLPLPAEASAEFRMLPEYLFDNVAEYYDFLARYDPEAMDDTDKNILINFAITFLSPTYVNNPFLKAKLVSILAHGLYPVNYHRKGTLFERLSYHNLSTEFLMPTLIRFFIDVEMTGGHTQFWDKFSFRRDISRIIKSMWENPLHREAFIKSRHNDFDQFIKFINMLMSDTTFHLEESLTGLAKINTIRAQMADEAGWNAIPKAERDDLESTMHSAESSAPFHTQLGRDHVELIRDITATAKEPFITAEIVDRLAATLDENLVTLIGPKMQELKMADADKFSFKPKKLLAAIAQIYLNLGNEAEFIRAVANDGRSYSKEVFEKFARILKNRAIMTDSEVSEVVAFTQKVEDMKATIMIEDEREIPDEFLDPLLATLMKDPVILPVSRVTVDRGTIRAVLLSKELDPFNNVPLKFEDCVPDVELKAKIDAWVAEGYSKPAPEVMDVDQL
ncbi:ubiquitin conjugation factor E4 B, partial [Tremellales sp. Uapishka_1]